MTIWVLQREDSAGWDEAGGFVVRAPTEDAARRRAALAHRAEPAELWLDPRVTTCEEVPQDGPLEVVLVDYRGS
jgi:hypothetical protein